MSKSSKFQKLFRLFLKVTQSEFKINLYVTLASDPYHDCPIWGFAGKTNMKNSHNKGTRDIRNDHQYFRNITNYKDLHTISIKEVLTNFQNFFTKLFSISQINKFQNYQTTRHPTSLIGNALNKLFT